MIPRSLLPGGLLGLLASVPLLASTVSPLPAGAASGRAPIDASIVAAPSHFASGVADLRSRQYKLAEREFTAAINAHDHTALAYAYYADAAFALRDFAGAFHAYSKAAALEPKNADFQYGTAYEALYTGDYHASITYATAFLKLQPRAFKGYHLRFLAESRLYEAKAQVQDAAMEVRLQPKQATAHNDYGIALANDKKYKQALAELTYAIKLEPNNFQFYVNRAQTENQDKMYRPAVKDLQKARSLTHDPTVRKQLDAAITYIEKQIQH